MRDKVRITKSLEHGWCVIWPTFGFAGKMHVEPLGSWRACMNATSQHKINDAHNGGSVTTDSWVQRDVYVGNRTIKRLDIC